MLWSDVFGGQVVSVPVKIEELHPFLFEYEFESDWLQHMGIWINGSVICLITVIEIQQVLSFWQVPRSKSVFQALSLNLLHRKTTKNIL